VVTVGVKESLEEHMEERGVKEEARNDAGRTRCPSIWGRH
jgi:hypothetical protein